MPRKIFMRQAFHRACCAALLLLALLSLLAAQREAAGQQQLNTNKSTKSTTAASPSPTPAANQTNANSATTTATTSRTPLDINIHASESAIDDSIKDDPATEAVIAPYSGKVRELNQPIGKLVGQLRKGGMGGGSLGNFVADAIRNRASARLGKPVLLAVTNSGGLRKNQITEGDLSSSDIYELLPFENALIAIDLTGEQLRRFLDVIVARRDAQSGARIVYRSNTEKKNEIVSVTLGDAGQINPTAVYTIVTIDYLYKRGGDYAVLQEAKNVKPLNLSVRDAVLEYVKAETAAGRPIKAMLDGRFKYDRTNATQQTTEENQP